MPATDEHRLGENGRKANPKLRMYANSDSEVNMNRAEQSGCIAVSSHLSSQAQVSQRGYAQALSAGELTSSAFEQPKVDKTPLNQIPDDILVPIFLETLDLAERLDVEAAGAGEKKEKGTLAGIEITAQRGNLSTAVVRLSDLKKLVDDPAISYIEVGQTLAVPTPVISPEMNVTPPGPMRRFGDPEEHRQGEGVLIGIIDVQGFDFAHSDFIDENGMTRFVRIWDQGGNNRPSPHARAGKKNKALFGVQFDFGSEIRQEDMNAALEHAEEAGVAPQDLEPQSKMAPRSHGTHVASIAAGNSGVCSKAKIAAVLISLPEADLDPRRSFYDSTRIAHAVDYLFAVGEELGLPVSINISLGTNGHAHDSSSTVSRWLDSALAVPGRCVCIAAGNAGQHASEFDGDLGWVMGRIHTSGQVAASGLITDIEWEVVGDGRIDVSGNELEIWYAPQDQFAVSIRPPGMSWIGPINPGEYIENHFVKNQQGQLQCVLSIYNEPYHPANGDNYIAIYLAPHLKQPFAGIASGTWTVRLHGIEVRDGRYHGWIERDDPHMLKPMGDRQVWFFPSYFSERSNIDNSSVSTLACGERIISVANLDEARECINISSSQGPTRDNRFKPDVAAPGTNVVAASGFGDDAQPWVKMTGTSMASPFVAGVAGLMLAIEPRLTSAQIEGIIHRTARPLPGADFKWANDAGFGRISPDECLRQAATAYKRTEVKR